MNNRRTGLEALSAHLPLVAILRGLRADMAAATGAALVEAGITLIEVPLNREGAADAIHALARACGGKAVVGAGTVLDVPSLRAAADAGAQLIVSPHFDVRVVEAALQRGLLPMPGVLTPTEAFAAIGAGATHLKLFPADAMSPVSLRAMRAVIPPGMARLYPVGGIVAGNMGAWLGAGADGFGLGSALFKPDWTVAQIAAAAAGLVSAYKAARGKPT